MKQTLTDLKGETDNSTIIFGDFITTLIATERTTRQGKLA